MSVTFKAYQDADGNLFLFRENGDEDQRATAAGMTRVQGKDVVTSNDLLTDETPVTVSQITDFASEVNNASPVQTVNNNAPDGSGNITIDQSDVGLGNVDNTSDADKPISTAQAAALAGKYDSSNPAGYQTAAQVTAISQALVDGLIAAAPELLNTLDELAQAIGDDPNFATTVANQIAAVQTQVTANDTDISNLQTEQTTQNTNISQNASDIAQEITDRTNADAGLQTQITNNDTDIGTVTTGLAQEVTDRTNADTALQSQITSNDTDISTNASAIVTESAARAAADSNLQSQIDTNTTGLAQEVTDRTNADTALQTQITSNDTDIATNASGLAQEITDRTNADTALQSQITSNDTDIATNASDIAQEVTDRTNADAGLQTQITNNDTDIATNASDIAQEVTDRTNADTALQTQITNNDTDIANIQTEQTTQNTAIAANTAKVSADGPVSSHSDVDLTGIASGDTLEWNGSALVPKSILNGFTIFPIWAEENGGIANGQYEWSWGNGAVGALDGIVIPFDCEIFAFSFNAEAFAGTSASMDIELDGTIVQTSNFTSANDFDVFTAVPVTAGQRLGFRTNTLVGTAPNDVRVCAWLRVRATAAFPTPDRSVVSGSGIGFTSGTFIDIPGMTTTVTLTDVGTIDAMVNYSALRSGAANAEAEFRVVINGDNGQVFPDTLSTFNDNGSAAHFVQSLPAGTYTISAQAQTTEPITITSISLTATGVED